MEKILECPRSLYQVFERKPGEDKTNTHYCPGCGHGIIHKLIGEALDELGIAGQTILISPVGCSVFAYYYFDCGNVQAAHGRAPAVATGLTRANRDNYLISYQGDGDLAAIGTAEIIHAANRGEKMTVFFVNNAIYGMTGGQMAPTSLLGQRTTTSPFGRSRENEGAPLRVAELVATLDAPLYVSRVSVHDVKHIMRTRTAILTALRRQVEYKGFSLVEILSQCPSQWKLKPTQSRQWMEQHMLPYFPLGVFRDQEGTHPESPPPTPVDSEAVRSVLGIGQESKLWTCTDVGLDRLRVLVAGFGGQGVLLLGGLLTRLGMAHGFEVTWLPSYGPEMRGGTANCSVVMAREAVGSPVVEQPDLLIAMNGPSFQKFVPDLSPQGTVLYNSSIIENAEIPQGIRSLAVPASEIARQAGSERAANVVMLGVFSVLYPGFQSEGLRSLLQEQFSKPELLELNRQAFEAGIAFALAADNGPE